MNYSEQVYKQLLLDYEKSQQDNAELRLSVNKLDVLTQLNDRLSQSVKQLQEQNSQLNAQLNRANLLIDIIIKTFINSKI